MPVSSVTPQSPITTSTNSSMTPQASLTTCATCAACPGITFGNSALATNAPTSNDDGDYDDLDYDDDPEPTDGDTSLAKRSVFGRTLAYDSVSNRGRSLAGRFSWEDRKTSLVRRAVTKNKLGSYAVGHDYFMKPPHPKAENVVHFEKNPGGNQAAKMNPFYQTAAYWAIPQDVPVGSCDPPTWEYKTSDELSTLKNPGPWRFQPKGAVPLNRYVDMDHVYEAKFLAEFLAGLLITKKRTCSDLNNDWSGLAGEEPRSPAAGGRKGQLPTRLNVIFSMLASYDHPEFVGMAREFNALKDVVTGRQPWSEKNAPAKLTGTASDIEALIPLLLMDAYNEEKFRSLWETTNARIYAGFKGFDAQTKPSCNPESQFLYAPAYKTWVTNRIESNNQRLQTFINDALAAIPTDDSNVADRLSKLTTKYPPASMTIPSPRGWDPKDANDRAVNGVVQWVQATPTGLVKKRACPAITPSSIPVSGTGISRGMSSVVPTNGLDGTVVGGGNNPPVLAGNIAVNGLEPVSRANPLTSSAIVTTPISSSLLPTTTSLTSSTIITPSSSSPSVPVTTPLALPVLAATTSSAPPATSINPHGDPCGPSAQEPGYPNTCEAKVNLTTTPSQYGVYCGSSGSGSLTWSACRNQYMSMCLNIGLKDFPKDAWVWGDSGAGCAVGAWMPSGAGAAMAPSSTRCITLIYQAMVDSCSTTVPATNIGSVNLATLPSFDKASPLGSQVNVGYMSFIIAPKSPRGLSKSWIGWTTADPKSIGQGAALDGANPNQQKEPNKSRPL